MALFYFSPARVPSFAVLPYPGGAVTPIVITCFFIAAEVKSDVL